MPYVKYRRHEGREDDAKRFEYGKRFEFKERNDKGALDAPEFTRIIVDVTVVGGKVMPSVPVSHD
jgi:hypothetical protein